MRSISGDMPAEHHIKSPPCAKEGVDGVDGRIVYYNPSVTAAPCHLPLHRGGFYKDIVPPPRVCCDNSHTGEAYNKKAPLWASLAEPLRELSTKLTEGLFIKKSLMNFQAASFPQSPGQRKGTEYQLPAPAHHRTGTWGQYADAYLSDLFHKGMWRLRL